MAPLRRRTLGVLPNVLHELSRQRMESTSGELVSCDLIYAGTNAVPLTRSFRLREMPGTARLLPSRFRRQVLRIPTGRLGGSLALPAERHLNERRNRRAAGERAEEPGRGGVDLFAARNPGP